MLELALALGLAAVLAAGAAILALVPWDALLVVGAALVALGLAVGIPAGLLYHVRLHRALAPRLPPRWWLAPVRHHDELGAAGRPAVMRPFYLGAAGFFLILVGSLLAAAGAVRGR